MKILKAIIIASSNFAATGAIFVVVAVLGAAGCSDYSGGNQISTAQNESAEQPNFGSATDISSQSGSTTNNQNAADIGLGGPMQRATGNYQSQPLPGQASDQELEKQIKVALTTGSMGTTGVLAKDQLTRIDVAVQNSVVTLRGPVSSEQEKQIIGKQVSGMKGVASVRNELTVGARPLQDKPLEPIVPRTPGNQ
jgi:osmotically-inducible protein OsmY